MRKRFNIKHINNGSTEEVIVKSVENVGSTDNVSTTNVDEADIFAMFEVISRAAVDSFPHTISPSHKNVQMHLFKMLFVSAVAGRTLIR